MQVLLIEPEGTGREATRRELLGYGLEVEAVGCADAARARIVGDAESWSMVLIDVALEDTDPLDLLVELHAHPALLGIPVLLMADRMELPLARRAVEAGVQQYILKPFLVDDLKLFLSKELEAAC